jgi:large subunit ribosomal protein L20
MLKSLSYAYRHRRERKGDMRRLWISRVNAASRSQGLTYSQFMNGLKRAGVEINRKMLADMAVRDPEAFVNLVTMARGQVQD